MARTDLVDAANFSQQDMHDLYITTGIKTPLTTFGTTCLALFPDSAPDGHPAMNWSMLILALASDLTGTVSILDFQTAVQYVYRMCLMTNELKVEGLITNAQAAAVLAAYNANIF